MYVILVYSSELELYFYELESCSYVSFKINSYSILIFYVFLSLNLNSCILANFMHNILFHLSVLQEDMIMIQEE